MLGYYFDAFFNTRWTGGPEMIILFLVFTSNIGELLCFALQAIFRTDSILGSAFSQTALTLFEFGTNRLAFGTSTRPLFPLGTASGNSQTTYLYEVLRGASPGGGCVYQLCNV